MNDALGTRIKENYENRTRYYLPRRTYTILRIDGKAFHTYTKNLKKPFDEGLVDDFDNSVKTILPELQGAQFAYVQSDEASILLTDFSTPNACAWFDGNIQKIVSVAASLMTMQFNGFRVTREMKEWFNTRGERNIKLAAFDARVFTIPDWIEVYNYFVWRNQDAARNSVQMVARSLYSHKECNNKSCAELQEMIYQKGINWANYNEGLKNGRLIIKEKYYAPDTSKLAKDIKAQTDTIKPVVERSRWSIVPAYIFTQRPSFLQALIPKYV